MCDQRNPGLSKNNALEPKGLVIKRGLFISPERAVGAVREPPVLPLL